MLKLSQAQLGQVYQINQLDEIGVLSKRLAVLGLYAGVLIRIITIHKHGAVVKTSSGQLAIGADVLEAIHVSHQAQ